MHASSILRPDTRYLAVFLVAGAALLLATGCGVVTGSSSGVVASPSSSSGTLPNPSSTSVRVPSPSSTSAAAGGTVDGKVVARSSCGAQSSATPCPLAPAGNRVLTIETSAGVVVATVTSDQQGHFSVVLPAGHYVVKPAARTGTSGTTGSQVAVDVVAGQTVSVQIVVSASPPRM
jgi:hypothetical protein